MFIPSSRLFFRGHLAPEIDLQTKSHLTKHSVILYLPGGNMVRKFRNLPLAPRPCRRLVPAAAKAPVHATPPPTLPDPSVFRNPDLSQPPYIASPEGAGFLERVVIQRLIARLKQAGMQGSESNGFVNTTVAPGTNIPKDTAATLKLEPTEMSMFTPDTTYGSVTDPFPIVDEAAYMDSVVSPPTTMTMGPPVSNGLVKNDLDIFFGVQENLDAIDAMNPAQPCQENVTTTAMAIHGPSSMQNKQRWSTAVQEAAGPSTPAATPSTFLEGLGELSNIELAEYCAGLPFDENRDGPLPELTDPLMHPDLSLGPDGQVLGTLRLAFQHLRAISRQMQKVARDKAVRQIYADQVVRADQLAPFLIVPPGNPNPYPKLSPSDPSFVGIVNRLQGLHGRMSQAIATLNHADEGVATAQAQWSTALSGLEIVNEEYDEMLECLGYFLEFEQSCL